MEKSLVSLTLKAVLKSEKCEHSQISFAMFKQQQIQHRFTFDSCVYLALTLHVSDDICPGSLKASGSAKLLNNWYGILLCKPIGLQLHPSYIQTGATHCWRPLRRKPAVEVPRKHESIPGLRTCKHGAIRMVCCARCCNSNARQPVLSSTSSSSIFTSPSQSRFLCSSLLLPFR